MPESFPPVPPLIAYVTQMPVTERDRHRYGMDYFRRAGFRILVVDAADVVFPRLTPVRTASDAMTDITIRVVRERSHLGNAVRELAEAAMIFCLVGSGFPNPDNLAVLRAMVASRRPFVIPYANPAPGGGGGRRRGLVERLRQGRPLHTLVARLPLPLLSLRPADAVIVGGRRSRIPMPLVAPTTRVINAFAHDYEQFLAARALDLPRTETAVYLDTYMGYHPDSIAYGYGPPVAPDRFYPRLRALFDRVEAELGLSVIIAAHPRADYRDKPGLYGDRPLVVGRTAELLSQCRLALGCHSTASGLAVLFDRPLRVLAMREMVGHPAIVGVLDRTAASVGRTIDVIDDPATVDLSTAFAIDRSAYDRYVTDYIKLPETPDRPYWDLVRDELGRHGLLPA